MWLNAIVLIFCASGEAQIEGLPGKEGRDYFAVANGTSAGATEMQALEHRYLRSALLKMQQGKPRDAIRDCTLLLDRIVNHPKVFAILGTAAQLAKEPLVPIAYFERALQRYPTRAMTSAQYGKYLAEIGKTEEGIQRLRQAIETTPRLRLAYTWLARVYMQKGQPDLARQTLQQGREAEFAFSAQGTEAGMKPLAETFQGGDQDPEPARDAQGKNTDASATPATQGTIPTDDNSMGWGAEQ